jgi:type IV secretion system protein VirB10
MHLLHRVFTVAIAGLLAAGLPNPIFAQSSPQSSQSPTPSSTAASTPEQTPPASPSEQGEGTPGGPTLQPNAAADTPAVPAKPTYTVPAGTKVLLELRSAINTKSARQGDGVYLASTFPVVVGTRVLIPAGVYVQGTVDRVVRAGHVKGNSQLDMHFTSIIFPNGTVVEIPGIVNGLPGADKQKVKDDGEGTIEQAGDKGRNAGKVAEIAIPTGGTVGSIGGLAGGHPIAGGLAGIGAGIAAAGLVSLFTRGADVNITSGTQVEMLLQRPLVLQEENLSGVAQSFVPLSSQPKPLEKPDRAHLLCPPGSLGCG